MLSPLPPSPTRPPRSCSIAKFLPKINDTITKVDRMYSLGKDIFLKWFNIDTWVEREAVQRLTFNTWGKDNASLANWTTLPYCTEDLCIRQETRSSESYKTWVFPVRYMQFWDREWPRPSCADCTADSMLDAAQRPCTVATTCFHTTSSSTQH